MSSLGSENYQFMKNTQRCVFPNLRQSYTFNQERKEDKNFSLVCQLSFNFFFEL